ncbi:T9SS type A sorting domain-containing protein [Niastella populi]|nr:T9SS type A sorting domain-containing protein [Niastella populi]
MKRMLQSCALLLLCAFSTGMLQAQLEEDFTPNPPNWILANGYGIHNVNGNDVILSAAGNNPGTIGTPIVQKAANTNTVTYCFDVFGYTPQDGLGELPCGTTVDLYFTNTTVNNANDLDETDDTKVYGSVKDIAVPADGGRVCHAFTFPASVTVTQFRVFLVINKPDCMGNTRFAFDNFTITGLSEVCTGAACAPVALPDVFTIVGPPGITSINVVLYGDNPSFPAPPAGYLVYAPGTDNDPNDTYSALTWTLLTPPDPVLGTVTMNPGGQGTATITRSSLSITLMTFVYQLCDPNGNCDTAIVRVLFPAGGALPVTLLNFSGNRFGGNVVLNWTTANESDNAGFEIHRLIDGEYKQVGFVNSREGGNSAFQLKYQYSEINNTNAVSWYRLVQINKDGTKKILPTLAVRGLEDLKKMLIYPNPGSTVNVLFGSSAIRDVSVVDLAGKLIKRWNNYSDDNITIAGLQAGMYLLQVTDRNTKAKMESKILISR